VLSDGTIDSIPDNAVYTITFKDAGNNIVETRTKKLPKRPYKRSELTQGHFAGFSGFPTTHKFSDWIGKTFNFTYTKPTAYITTRMEFEYAYWNNSGNYYYDYETLLLNQTSESVTLPSPGWTPLAGYVGFFIEDSFLRRVEQKWMLEP
jgi:hypothetical protein